MGEHLQYPEYPTGLVSAVSPIPEDVDQSFLNTNAPFRNGLAVVRGLTEDLAQQLTQRSLEDSIVRYCEEDSQTRFRTLDAVRAWQNQGRLTLPLVDYTDYQGRPKAAVSLAHDEERLAHIGNGDQLEQGRLIMYGMGWLGPKRPSKERDEPDIPGATTNFALRLYIGGAGKGNAIPYAKAILDTHQSLYGNEGIWLSTWADNDLALHVHEQVGFVTVDERPGVRHGKRVSRIFQTLGDLATTQER